jgi:putative sigma-54 modulation protein
MTISLEGRNFELTEAISNRIEKAITKALEKFEEEIVRVTVVMDFMKHRKGGQPSAEVKIHVEVPGPDVVAENAHDDLYEAVDGALDRVVDQIQKRREK